MVQLSLLIHTEKPDLSILIISLPNYEELAQLQINHSLIKAFK